MYLHHMYNPYIYVHTYTKVSLRCKKTVKIFFGEIFGIHRNISEFQKIYMFKSRFLAKSLTIFCLSVEIRGTLAGKQ
jgi:hypothetical protein